MIPISVLDLSPIAVGSNAGQALHNSLDLARHVERLGYNRLWLAEHHNMPGIASAATAVALAHVASGTSTIRLGAGGIMLPNHAPLMVAEAFGTLAALHPGRIDLGVGRAPGTDQITAQASDNILYGNLGSDTLNGGTGNDLIRGGQGDDVLQSGAGNDWMSGDRGSDTLTGGAGADTFHAFSGAGMDVVTDFNSAEGDRVQLDAGTTWHASQSGADVLIDMGNGDEMILRNVTLSALPSGWIFTL